ncbi:MAG: hypothetical protein KKH61_21245 [Gammaproteobacteria bacterium]|uniref:Uncharacterized protein n=1 Tax=viral metagenome TaxID=1070528 RepID=A0A6H1ZBR7_9ZZZZ|nr:hypothetical protein [Gammaproteobacteria bacterium]
MNVVNIKDGVELPPDFVTRIDVNSMSDQELDEFLERIRMRRMASFIIYQTTQAELAEMAEEKAKIRLTNEVTQIEKLLTTLDKQFEKLEIRINKMRGLRIQAGMSVM